MLPTKRAAAIIAATGLILLALFIVNPFWAQFVFGFFLALVLPGYTITQALLPRQLWGVPERLVLSIGVSLAVDALGGLVLNLTPWGLQATTWALLLIGISVLFASIAILRKTLAWPSLALQVSVREGMLFGIAIVIALAAFAVALLPASQQSIEGYTNFWVVPSDSSNPPSVRFGVSSMEIARLEYLLKIKVNNQIVAQSSTISLNPGELWEGTLEIPIQTSPTRIEADLYRLDNPQAVYRQINLNRNK